ncbi:MAG: hypothetical protein Q4D79_06980 [Propionibacteriaceae bacterium]|nr:hypothetical protein [Propionibacteriaceae bacterium]
MSALPAEVEPVSTRPAPQQRPRLRIVAVAPTTVSTVGFLAILAALVVVGMAVVMIVTTQVGAQSRELTALRKEAETLSYEQAALVTELQEVSSSGSLALRAAELGMVPNPYPAFVDLPTGSILGEPQPVSGDEAPFLTGRNPADETTEAPTTSAETTPSEPAEETSAVENSAEPETTEESTPSESAPSQEPSADPAAQTSVDTTENGEG